MSVKVLFFGPLVDKVSSSILQIDGVDNTQALHEKLYHLFPSLSEVPFSLSVNKKIVHQNEALKEGDEVACLPPFSGG